MNNLKIIFGMLALVILSKLFMDYNGISFNFFNKETPIINTEELIKKEYTFARETEFCRTNEETDRVCRVELSNKTEMVSIELLERDVAFIKNKQIKLEIKRINDKYCLDSMIVDTYVKQISREHCSIVYFKKFN
jgi:hypothetical protein